MKQFLTFILLLLVGCSVYAQDFPKRFGVVSQEELTMTAYDKDPEAEAVVLYDIGEASYIEPEYGYRLQFTRTKRIKLLKKGAEEYATVSIPLYHESYLKSEEIMSLEAFTYNYSDGMVKKTALDPEAIYEEKISDKVTAHKFTFPDIKDGSVLEVRYVTKSPYNMHLPDWNFQAEIPTVYSQYTVNLIPFYEFVFYGQGISQFDYTSSQEAEEYRYFDSGITNIEFRDVVNTYVMKDVPAFESEAYITSKNDYIMKLHFQGSKVRQPTGGVQEIMTTWPKMAEDLMDHEYFGKYLKKSKKYAKKIIKSGVLNLNGKSEHEKARLIIEYVKTAFSWDGYYSKYATKKSKDFFEQKTGSTAELNLFMTAMLNYAGIEAEPVILSTRGHGKINTQYPFSSHFNYVIVLVKGSQPFLADATRSALAYNRIPPYCINEKGLVVNEDKVGWIDLNSSLLSSNMTVLNMELDVEHLKAKTFAMVQATEYEAYQFKAGFEGDSEKLMEYFKKKGFDKLSDFSTHNYEASNKPYVMRFAGEYEVEELGGKLVVAPFMKFPMQENKLTQRKRSYPVDMIYAYNDNFKSSVTIPQGYEVAALPEDYATDNELVAIKLTYAKHENTVDASASYTFKKPVYQPEEYARIKNYMRIIVEKLNQPLVFEKATEGQARK